MTSLLTLHSKLPLGTSQDGIPIFGLGVYRASFTYNVAGYRHIDTAAFYQNESDVGRAIRDCGIPRKDIFVTTKLWDADQGGASTKKAFHTSLKKLGLDYVDLYLIHSPFPGKERRQASWKAMMQLQSEGLIRHIGVSNFGIHHIKEFMEAFPEHPPVVNQIEVHPFLTRSELVAYCQAHGMVVEAYSPLAKARRSTHAVVNAMAKKHEKTWAQVMLRWGVQKGLVVIPKSEKKERIIANADVFGWELSEKEMAELDGLDEGFCTGWDPTTCP